MILLSFLSLLIFIGQIRADNECLNGKDPKQLTKKQILIEFSKGPCSPLVIIHGILSSKIIVEIDCPVLRAEHPDIFKLCGWTDCVKTPKEFWKSVPNTEYHIWIPGFSSPMDIFSFTEKTNLCWAKFTREAIDFTKPLDEAVIENKGFKVKVFGSTELTKSRYDCGDEAIRNMFDSYIQPSGAEAFKSMLAELKKMGYIPGLTYQSIPYNFKLPLGANELNIAFQDNIIRLNDLTRKKVMIVSHSYGGVNTLYQLNKMDTSFKQKNIKLWISIVAPFLGAIKAYKTIVSGSDELSFLSHHFGLHLKASLEAVSSSMLTFLSLAIDPFTEYKGQKWFKSIEKRMQYEEGLIPYELTDLKFLPKTEEKCSPANYYPFNEGCSFGFYNTTDKYTVKIDQDEYKIIDTMEMITKWDITDRATSLYGITRRGFPTDLKNPEVPIISINLRSDATEIRYTYGPDLRKNINENTYYNPTTEYGMGDGSVVSYSQFIPLLKWAKEFEDKQKGAQPVKIVDYCSVYKNKYDPFDSANEKGEKVITDNEFFGIPCDCINDKVPTKCNHSVIISDSSALKLFVNTVKSNEVSYDQNYENFVNTIDDEYLDVITITCPQVIYK